MNILRGLLEQFLAPSRSIYWPYLVTALLLAIGVYIHRTPHDRSIRGALGYVFPRSVWLHRSVAHDLMLFVVNALLYSFVFVGPLQWVTGTVGTSTWAFLHETLGPLDSPWTGPAAVAALTVAVFVVADLAFFISHVLVHKIPVLWPFHEVHHSAPVLVPFTVFRRHPVDVVFDAAIAGALLGLLYGAAGYLGGEALQPATILGVNIVLFVGLVAGFNLQHSHVWLSFGPLNGVFISPATHQIHHSTAPEHVDRNFGNLLAIWDRIAGTLVRPEPRGSVEFGLGDGSSSEYRSLARLLLLPFVRSARALARKGRAS